MSQFGDPSNGPDLEEWKVPLAAEGFARITRDGATDICLVQNHVGYGWDGQISVAFYMDDFDSDRRYRNYGVPLFMRKTDQIECLRMSGLYFSRVTAGWEIKRFISRNFPRSAGLLPAVRTCETLMSLGVELTGNTTNTQHQLASNCSDQP
jgi:hypothetical protein